MLRGKSRLLLLLLAVAAAYHSAEADPQIFWANSDSVDVNKVNLDGSSPTVIHEGISASLTAYDSFHDKLYWTGEYLDGVYRSNLDGSSPERILQIDTSALEDLEIDPIGQKLYWSDSTSNRIQRVNLDGTTIETILTASGTVSGFGLDVANGYIYYGDNFGQSLHRVNLDGTGSTSLGSVPFSSGVSDVAVDATGGHLFWASEDGDKVMRTDLSGGNQTDLLTSIYLAKRIQLDPTLGKLFVASAIHLVDSANLDGSGHLSEPIGCGKAFGLDSTRGRLYFRDSFKGYYANAMTLATTDVYSAASGDPRGVSVDAVAGKMYWADRENAKIRRSNFDGTNIETVVSGSGIGAPQGVQLDLVHQELYWADTTSQTLEKINLNTLTRTVIVSGLNYVENFTLDIPNGKIYLAAFLDHQIRSINSDGTNLQTLYTGGDYVWALDIDRQNQVLYWTEGLTIKKGSLSGGALTGISTIVSSGIGRPIGIRYYPTNGNLYFVDDIDDTVRRVNTDGTGLVTLVSSAFGAWGLDLSYERDYDLDTLTDSQDNCPSVSNSTQLDTNADGAGDACDDDDDGDGLSDTQEGILGTNPLLVDSDGDAISDSQEVTDGTDPLDDSSFHLALATSFCSEWNGFLGLWNIAEFVNLTNSGRDLTASLYDMNGVVRGAQAASILPGAQFDLLVHDMSGFTANAYGKLCANISGASAGDIDGRMVHYRYVNGAMQFAFAMPFNNGMTGSVFVPFNTFQPSLDAADTANQVANFITVLNLDEAAAQDGTLFYYGQDGSPLGSDATTLNPGQRVDFSAHQFGRNLVGLAEWRPNSAVARFQVRNIRYLYNNPRFEADFDSAVQLEAIKGSNQELLLPIDTRSASSIVEISNSLNTTTSYSLTFYSGAGATVSTMSETLAAHQTRHYIADGLLVNTLGSARVVPAGTGKVTATVMQYGRTTSGGVDYLYGIHGRESGGSVLRGSYNNFLNQGCRLIIISGSDSGQTVSYSMTRWDGTVVVTGETISLPARGTAESDVCANDGANTLGVVSVQPQTANSTVATIVRIGANNRYRFPTAVR